MNKFINGGMLAGHRTYIVSGIGILSAVGSYLTGDINLFEMMAAVYPMAGIYFLRKGMDKKGSKNANTRKISK